MGAGQNILAAALAAGLPLPHSCRAGRCASCKAKLLSGTISYPGGHLPPGIVASEAARGEVLLCQAQPRDDLEIQSRLHVGPDDASVHGVAVENVVTLTTGGSRVTLRIPGERSPARPGQFVEVETSAGERERVAVVAAGVGTLDVELLELAPGDLLRLRGPFDAPR